MFKMGGLRRELPVAFWTFLIGSASLAALPLVTAGFYSKDLILFEAWSSAAGGPWLWLAGLVGALLTVRLHLPRWCSSTFFGDLQRRPAGRPGWRMNVPLVVLAVLAIVGGFVELPLDARRQAATSRMFLRVRAAGRRQSAGARD